MFKHSWGMLKHIWCGGYERGGVLNSSYVSLKYIGILSVLFASKPLSWFLLQHTCHHSRCRFHTFRIPCHFEHSEPVQKREITHIHFWWSTLKYCRYNFLSMVILVFRVLIGTQTKLDNFFKWIWMKWNKWIRIKPFMFRHS